MQDEPETSSEENGPVGGERLRKARRENDVSVRDIAKELHLDELKVRALEKNEFDVLGAPVFAKGHLRKYAELVGVSTDDIMSDYYQMNRAVGAPPVVGPKRKQSSDTALGPWIAGAVAVAVAAAGGYWWYNREAAPATPATNTGPASLAPAGRAAAEDTETDGPTSVPATLDATSDIVSESAEDAPEPTEREADDQPPAEDSQSVDGAPAANQTIREPVVAAESGLPQVSIELTYTGDCWTEVSDASGRRLYYDLGRTGRTLTLSGDAPLRVILGDIGNVTIKVGGEDEDYVVPRSSLTGRLARLTLDSPQ